MVTLKVKLGFADGFLTHFKKDVTEREREKERERSSGQRARKWMRRASSGSDKATE